MSGRTAEEKRGQRRARQRRVCDDQGVRFHDLIEFHGRDQPDAIAVRDGGRSVSYGELLAESRSVADALVAAGLNPGDRYGVLAGNCLEYFSCYLGAAMANSSRLMKRSAASPPPSSTTLTMPPKPLMRSCAKA